jgi:hypothetical protein
MSDSEHPNRFTVKINYVKGAVVANSQSVSVLSAFDFYGSSWPRILFKVIQLS